MTLDARTASQASLSPTRHRARGPRWVLGLSAAAIAVLGASACGEPQQSTDPVPCEARAVQVVGDDGQCTWASSCESPEQTRCGEESYTCEQLPGGACELDSRCQLTTATACPGCMPGTDPALCACTTSSFCETKPSDGCAPLDEASCIATTTCHAEYGWLDGSTDPSAPDGGDQDAGAPCAPEFGCEMPEPPPPSWGFLGCVDNTTGPCAGLDEPACESHPGCEAIWGSGDCACRAGEDCACPDVVVYDGCQQVPNGCDAYPEQGTCDGADGCHWEFTWDDGGAAEPVPCVCPDDGSPCECDGFAPQPADGTCVPDYPLESCYDLYDQASCLEVGCEWQPYNVDGGTAPEPAPCYCDPADPECSCDGLVAPADGYCAPPTTEPPPPPASCADYADTFSCTSAAGCVWNDTTAECVEEIVEPPPPTPCSDLDSTTCQSTEGCVWNDGTTCDCDPADPACGCAGLVAPACDVESYRGADGVCYDSAGYPTDDYCCDGTEPAPPPGYCEAAPAP